MNVNNFNKQENEEIGEENPDLNLILLLLMYSCPLCRSQCSILCVCSAKKEMIRDEG